MSLMIFLTIFIIAIAVLMYFINNHSILIKLIVFLTPLTLAAFIPISFSSKVTAGSFILFLGVLYFVFVFSW